MHPTRRILAAAAIAAAMAGIALAGIEQVGDGSSGQAPASTSSHPIEFRLPTRGTVASGPVEITLRTDSSVARADIFIDGVLWKSSAPNSFDWNSARIWFSWNTAAVPNGNHTISVSAYDSTGAKIGSDAVDITVNNQMSIFAQMSTLALAGIMLINQTSALGSGSSCIVNKPAGTVSGDTMILMAFGGTTVTAPGFRAVPHGISGVTLTGSVMSLLYRIADGSEGSTITAQTSSGGGISCILQTWSGVNATAPFDPVATNPQFGIGTSTVASVNGITTQSDGDELLIFAGSTHNSDTGSWKRPTGFRNAISHVIAGGSIAGFSAVHKSDGTTGSISSGWTGAADARWAMGLLALQPAIADPPPTPTPTSSPTPTATPTPTSTPTPTPTPGSTPAPPVLHNPQDPVTYGADPSGINNSWSAFQAALNNGDLDIHAGTYLLVPTYGTTGYGVPSGRNVHCENSVLPAGPGASVVLKVTAPPTNSFNLFYEWSNGTLYGCEVEGYHYPNTRWTGDTNAGADDSFVREYTASDFKAYNNGFDGWGGSTAPFDMNVASPTLYSQGRWPSNIDISYNRFANCNVRGVEIDYGRNIRITHNTYVDCPEISEIQNYTYTGMSVLFDSNSFTFTYGSHNGGTSGWDNMASAGAVCISGHNPCGASWPSDYSGNTFSNNTVTTTAGSSVTPYLVENLNCVGYPSGSINPAIYRNNTCSGNCQRICPPGNSNANSWGPGSNQ